MKKGEQILVSEAAAKKLFTMPITSDITEYSGFWAMCRPIVTDSKKR